LNGQIEAVRQSIAERPEFMVRFVSIDGAGDGLSDRIREILPVRFPVSAFDLDLGRIQAVIESLDDVASAEVHVRPGDILHIAVNERVPVAIWRVENALSLVDGEGWTVDSLSRRADRADLPLVVGEGAGSAISEALEIVAAARPLETRLRGLVRVGERRWDVVLDRDQRIMLPEADAVVALERVIALDDARDLLGRDVVAVDMRNPRRPTARMRQEAVEEMRRIKALETGDADR